MKLFPEFAVRRPIGATMLFSIVLVLGFAAVRELSIDMLPDITFPAVAVLTTYEGVSPEDMETTVTRPIEDAVSRVNNVTSVTSRTSAGFSVVIAEFGWGTNLDAAAQDVRDRVELVRNVLPEDAERPILLKMDLESWPIIYLGLQGRRSLEELRRWGTDVVSRQIEKAEGVAQVEVTGGRVREVQVELDLDKLEGYQIPVQQVVQALAQGNTSTSGGSVRRGPKEELIRLKGEVGQVEDFNRVVVAQREGKPVFLRDVAEVGFNVVEPTGEVRLMGEPAVGIIVYKQSAQNTVRVVQNVRRQVEKLKAKLPKDMRIVTSWDQARLIEMSISAVKQNAYYGILFTVLVTFFFLRSFRASLVVVTAIPFSIIGTFVLMYFADITVNVMSLGGLALGVGIIVDNAIVVLENVYRLLELGKPVRQAAIEGAQEVAGAIAASTFTTIAVFLPIAFISGIVGEMFREMAYTVAFALMVSLLFALTLSPMLAFLLFRLRPFQAPQHAGIPFLDIVHHRALSFALHRPFRIGAGVLAAALVALICTGRIGKDFLPPSEGGDIMVRGELPTGVPLEETEMIATRIEKFLLQFREISSLFVGIGDVQQDREGQAFGMGATDTHEFVAWAHLQPGQFEDQRKKSEVEAILRRFTGEIPHAKVHVVGGEEMVLSSDVGQSVEVVISGNDLNVLQALEKRAKQIVEGIGGVVNVASSLKFGKPELQVYVDREKASDLGLTVGDVATTLSTAFQGKTATKWRMEGKEYDVFVRLQEEDRSDVERLRQLSLVTPKGSVVKLGNVTFLRQGASIATLERKDHKRTITLSADVAGRDLGSTMQSLEAGFSTIAWPEGYGYEFGGKLKQMIEAFSKLGFALVVAVVLVYMVLAFQFESLLHPFVVMVAVPFSFIGAMILLYVCGSVLAVTSMIGLIMVVGIGVNDAIVLIDFINQLRAGGMGRREAIENAAKLRLRPIMLTSLTTIFALLPSAIGMGGAGAEMNIPLAISVIGGIISSTVLTLLVVPSVYILFDNLEQFLYGKRKRPREGT